MVGYSVFGPGTVTRLWTGKSRVQLLAGKRDFTLLQSAQISSAAHPASRAVGTMGSFHFVKVP